MNLDPDPDEEDLILMVCSVLQTTQTDNPVIKLKIWKGGCRSMGAPGPIWTMIWTWYVGMLQLIEYLSILSEEKDGLYTAVLQVFRVLIAPSQLTFQHLLFIRLR